MAAGRSLPMKARSHAARSGLAALALAVLVTLLVAVVVRLGLLEGVEYQGYDFLLSTDALPPPDELVFVDFDNAAMETWHVSRVPRDKLARVVARASEAGAEVIGIDVLLDEKRGAGEDAELSKAIGDAGNVVLSRIDGAEELPASEPLAEFGQRATNTGFVNLPVDSDGCIRRMILWTGTRGSVAKSFPVVIAESYLGQPLKVGRPGTYLLGEREVYAAPDAVHTALIGEWSSSPVRTVPVMHFLAPDFDPGMAKGKIVLVGQSSAKGNDRHPTPLHPPGGGRQMLSGTEVHAAAVASLLHGRTIQKLPLAPLWTLNLLLIGLIVLFVVRWRFVVGVAATLAGMFFCYLLAQGLFGRGVWMPFLSTDAGVLLALPAGLSYRYLNERKLKAQSDAERQELMGLFGRYVSPEVASEIWQRRQEIVLGGQERTVTILFSDIRNFTQLTEGEPSAHVLSWLNEYFTAMDEVIRENGGFLNKFIGDGLMVIFGVPLSTDAEADACHAVETAIEMLERVEELNRNHAGDATFPQLRIGVGIHTGKVTAGNVGSRNRLEYSVIGEAVNLASRLEAVTKEFETPLVMSPQTHALVRNHFVTCTLGETLVRGFSEKIQIFTATKSVTAGVRQ